MDTVHIKDLYPLSLASTPPFYNVQQLRYDNGQSMSILMNLSLAWMRFSRTILKTGPEFIKCLYTTRLCSLPQLNTALYIIRDFGLTPIPPDSTSMPCRHPSNILERFTEIEVDNEVNTSQISAREFAIACYQDVVSFN